MNCVICQSPASIHYLVTEPGASMTFPGSYWGVSVCAECFTAPDSVEKELHAIARRIAGAVETEATNV